MKGSLIVVAFFVLGVLAGRSGSIPEWMLSSGTSFVALLSIAALRRHKHRSQS